MKKFLLGCAILLLSFNIALADYYTHWKPLGTIYTYNRGGHAWDGIKIIQETKTVPVIKTWITIENYRINELGCQERVFQLYQRISDQDGVRVEFIREVVLETNCDF